jgi:hypothetical protein
MAPGPGGRREGTADVRQEDTSGWVVGVTVFAAVMLIMVGVWQALAGLIAIFQNEFYVQTREYRELRGVEAEYRMHR